MKNWFGWVVNAELRAALDTVLRGGKPDQANARAALLALKQESVTHIIRRVGGDNYSKYFPTNRLGGAWAAGQPSGVVDHYTASQSARGTLLWFSKWPREAGQGNSSAHVVVDRDGTIMIVVDPLAAISWHATVANRTHVGIEHVNAGDVDAGNSYAVKAGFLPEKIDGRRWDPFETAIIVSNIAFKRLLLAAVPTLRRDRFVDHHIVDPRRKVDCGPLWPLTAINDLVFSWKDGSELPSLNSACLSAAGVRQFTAEVRSLP